MNDADRYAALLAFEPSLCFQLTGSSMEPGLLRGQRVNCRRFVSFIAGNCYFFRYGGGVLLHRLVDICGEDAFFMGDNSGSVERVRCHDIIGELDDTTSPVSRSVIGTINRYSLLFTMHAPVPAARLIMRLRRKAVMVWLRQAVLTY